MAWHKFVVLALAITQVHVAEGAMMKALQKRTLAAAGLPDAHCKTGVISLKVKGTPQSCCAGYCGTCNDYKTCKSVNGQNSENACCASSVYKMRCGNAPANVCLKTCSEAVPPCIMDVEDMPVPKFKAVEGVPPCNEVVPFVAQLHEDAITKGEILVDLHVAGLNLQQAIDIAKSEKAKLEKDAKRTDLSKDISKKNGATMKQAEKVLKDDPKKLSKVQELVKEVAAVKVGEEISRDLKLRVKGATGDAEMEVRNAKDVKQASQKLHQQVLGNAAKGLAGAADKQADQYAKAQAAVADAKSKKAKEAAAAEAKKQEDQKKAAEEAAQKAAKKACAGNLAGLPCGQEWAFVTDSKGNLVAIKKGPKTGSGKTEVHRLTKASNYEKYDLQTATALQLTDGNWDFVMDSKDNLVAILKGPKTGSGKTEVHRMSAASNYLKFDLQTGTGLQYSDENWAFTMDSKDNLVCVLKGPSGSKKTEVHRLTASSNYEKFDLHTATGLHYTNAASNEGDWDFLMDPQDNLVCILKGPNSGSGKTEVHKLSASSNFGKFDLHTSTALHYSTDNWAFAMDKNDVVGILKGPTSGTCMTEVHKLNGAANYGSFVFETGTGLGLSAATSCAR